MVVVSFYAEQQQKVGKGSALVIYNFLIITSILGGRVLMNKPTIIKKEVGLIIYLFAIFSLIIFLFFSLQNLKIEFINNWTEPFNFLFLDIVAEQTLGIAFDVFLI